MLAEQTAGRTIVATEQGTVGFVVVVAASWSSFFKPVQTVGSDPLEAVEL